MTDRPGEHIKNYLDERERGAEPDVMADIGYRPVAAEALKPQPGAEDVATVPAQLPLERDGPQMDNIVKMIRKDKIAKRQSRRLGTRARIFAEGRGDPDDPNTW